MITALVGMPESVSCTGNIFRGKQADIVTATMKFSNETRGHFFVSWLHPRKERTLAVIGNKGSVIFSDCAYNSWALQISDGPATYYIDATPPLKEELEHFIECIETGAKPLTDGEDGLRVVRVLSACQQSMDAEGKRVEL